MNDSVREISPEEEERKRRPLLVYLLVRLVKEKPLGTVGGVIVLALLIAGIFADLSWLGLPEVGLAPYGQNELHLTDRLSPPSTQYLLGTDNLGRDVLSRVIYGARISIFIGLGATALMALVSGTIGLTSGFLGGKVDLIVQRFVDAWMCFPMLFILLTVMAIVGGGIIQIILVLGITGGIGGSRVSRSAVIAIKANMYVEAARAIGVPTGRILTRHILPNIMPIVIIGISISIGGIILSEASLSFLGFGIPPPTPSWGGMLSGTGRRYMLVAPWMMLWPGLALTTVVFGLNMFGDAIRDILDPRLRGGLGRYSGVKEKIAKKQEEEKRQQAR